VTVPTVGVSLGSAERAIIHRRSLRVLMVSQATGGAGVASAFAVGALLAEEVSGSTTLAGLAAAGLSVGSATATVPLASLMSRKGRRPGLQLGYSLAALGAVLAVVGGSLDVYLLVVVAIFLLGVASTTNLAARYAGADLAAEEERARSIGLLVWATTVGVVIGPTLVDPAGRVAEALGLEELTGPFLFSAVFLTIAAVNVARRLHPDPLVVAGGLGQSVERRWTMLARSTRAIAAEPRAVLAVSSLVICQAVMVGVMTMTPLYMKDHHHDIQVIGFVLSVHVLGMYAFAPIVGWMSDRVGRMPMIVAAGVTLVLAAVMAGQADPHRAPQMFFGLFLLGLGWSFGLIAASSLLVDCFDLTQRVGVQGAADLAMTGAGALGGIASGVVVQNFGYQDLNTGAAVLGLVLIGLTVATVVRTRSSRPSLAG
jgi:MFS family permease